MKKLLYISFILIISLSVTGCSSKEKKSSAAYMDWFGLHVDLREIEDHDIAPSMDFTTFTFDEYLKRKETDSVPYAVVRVKCTSDWTQKVYDEEHAEVHNVGISYPSKSLYTEISYQVLEILEGDQSIVNPNDYINVEIPKLFIGSDFMLGWNFGINGGRSWQLIYNEVSFDIVFPRVGYEYIIVIDYFEQTGCLAVTYGGPAICELSTPMDYYEYRSSFKNKENSMQTEPADFLPYHYHEVLDRYNITVE